MKNPENFTRDNAPGQAAGQSVASRPSGSGQVKYWRSLRGRLSLIFLLLFATIVVLGLASVWSLTASNEVSIAVRDRWLPNTRLLGDLNNYTSDYRTAEANSLLAASDSELSDALHDMETLNQQVVRAQDGYEAVRHDAHEGNLYRRFSTTWSEYKRLAGQVTALSSSGRGAEAAALYRTSSRTTYDLASDLLGQLTDYNVIRAAEASERSARAYERARWLLFGALGAAGLMLIFVISQVTRAVSHPLLDLGHAMRQLAANKTGIEIGHTDRTDEIGEMARAIVVFRGNAIELAQSQRGLAQQATMLEEKLAHEQYLTRLQNDFVSMITHEFRTPLTQIDAQAQRLTNLRERLDVKDVTERAGRMRAAVARIVRLIDNLLDASRLMGDDVNLFLHAEAIDLAAMLRDVCRSHREISPAAQILEDFSAEPIALHGDPKLPFQAVSNLVSNAIKYSPGQAKIKISATQRDGATRIVVEDEGVGIPEQDRVHIFTRYYRGSNVSGVVGTGVGLYFVATVVRLHGGDIAMESRQAKGSRFIVTLPNGSPAPAARSQPAAVG